MKKLLSRLIDLGQSPKTSASLSPAATSINPTRVLVEPKRSSINRADSSRACQGSAFARNMWAVLAAVAISATMSGSAKAQVNPLGSNVNYTLIDNCQSVEGLTVSLHVTQDMMSQVTGGYFGVNYPNGGFALQLNAAPPASSPFQWLQYGIIVEAGQALGFTQYWDPAGINEHNQPVIVNLPSDTIAAGSVLTIALTNDSAGNVNSITYSVTDPTNHTSTLAMPLPLYAATGLPALEPIEAFQVDVVGPINVENAAFSSGAGYLTYKVSSGSLTVQNSPSQCPAVYEAWEQAGTGETSNAVYGYATPGGTASLTQPFTTQFGGALASNHDTVNDLLNVYHLAEVANSSNVHLDEFAFNGGWSLKDVNASSTAPAATIGSPVASYENTIYGAPEAFYLVPNSAGSEQVEQLWGTAWSPSSLTNSAKAQPAAVGSGLAGFIDPIAVTDNVFYQGTDQHVHLLTWSPGAPWTEDLRVANSNAPVAAFASTLTGHMTASSEELFYLGTNQHVYELWRWSEHFDGWHLTDVTLANSTKPLAAIGSSLAGFYDFNAGTDAVFYVGTDQHVHELLFSGNTWTGVDATAQSGSPNPNAGTSLAAHINTIANSEEVFFVNGDQTIGELWSWSTTTPAWNRNDISTSASGNPILASPGSPLAVDIDSVTNPQRDEVFYIGTDGSVRELWWSGNWTAAQP